MSGPTRAPRTSADGLTLDLLRLENTSDGVFGTLTGPGLVLYTMEEDWRGNARRISCIPAGRYPLRRTIYYRHGFETFEVCDVPGRTRILIHPANTEEDVEGCIGVGLDRGYLHVVDEDSGQRARKRAVTSSKAAFERFMRAMQGVDEAWLEVAWRDGLP